MEELLKHPELAVLGAGAALELLLRLIPKAWPLTKILYEALDKIVKNRQ